MTLTRAPVEAASSVTELSSVTQMFLPVEVMAHGWSKPYLDPRMTLISVPVEAESSVTDWPLEFATQTRVPSEVMPREPLNPYLEPRMTLISVPVDAESSVTVLPRFTTQTWAPEVATAQGSSKPHPRTLTPESGLPTVPDVETREAPCEVAPTAGAGATVERARPDRHIAPTATVRRNRPRFVTH